MTRGTALLLFITLHTAAQNFRIKTYTTADGLPANYIFGVSQCSNRHLYIGTVNGASRFDGNTFINFGSEFELQSFFVDRVYEDTQHHVWLGNRGGIVQLISLNECRVYPLEDSAEVTFTAEILTSADKKTLWFTDKGAYQFEGTYWKKRKSLLPPYEPSDGAVLDSATYFNYGVKIVIERNNKIKVIGIDKERQPYSPYYRLMRKCNERIFVQTNYEFFEIVGDSLVQMFKNEFNTQKKLFIYWFLQDKKGRFWFATPEGLLISSASEERIVQRLPSLNNIVSDLFEDNEGNIWLATSNGLVKITEIISTAYPLGEGFSKAGSFVDKQGRIFIYNVTEDQAKRGVYIWSEGNLNKVNIPLPTGEVIDSFTEDTNGNIWMGGRFGTLFKLNGTTLTKLIPNPNYRWTPAINFNFKEKQLYICSDEVLLLNNSFTKFAIADNQIRNPNSVFFDKENGKWIATEKGSVYYVNGSRIEKMNEALGLREIRISGRVSFMEDKRNRIWIAYPGKGLRCYHRENGRMVFDFGITSACGLPDDFVVSCLVDNNNCIWAITNSGPVRINVEEKYDNQCYAITYLDKEADQHVNWSGGTIHSLKDGSIAFVLSNQILVFNISDLSFKKVKPKTILETAVIRNVTYVTDSIVPAKEVDRAKFTYDQNNITLNFHGVSYDDSRVLYSYRLKGNNEQWSTPSPSRSVSFLNLSPGDYSFEVKSKLLDTDWGDAISYSFIIKPPFWRTWWFESLVTIFFVGGVAGLAFIYLSRARAKQQIVSQIKDLELKALKSQMNPHFIFNAMNSIQALIANEKPSEALKYTSKFSKLLRIVLENSEKNFITLEKEMNALELYIQIEALRLNFDLEYSMEVDKSVTPELEFIPPLVVQPYVENALWHGLSNKESNRSLSLKFYANEEILYCEVTDNGIGRKKSGELRKNSGNSSRGHSITEKRLSLVNNLQDYSSVEFKDLYDENGQSAGTKVILKVYRSFTKNR